MTVEGGGVRGAGARSPGFSNRAELLIEGPEASWAVLLKTCASSSRTPLGAGKRDRAKGGNWAKGRKQQVETG